MIVLQLNYLLERYTEIRNSDVNSGRCGGVDGAERTPMEQVGPHAVIVERVIGAWASPYYST